MRARILAVAALAALDLAGCQPKNVGDVWAPHATGRYAGIGVYPAGTQWSKIAVSSRPADPAAARTSDDEHVIVVVDSQTGEVRQCGNLSGYCIGLNPWARALGAPQTEPVPLARHASGSQPANVDLPAESAGPAKEGGPQRRPAGRKSGSSP